jgi:hypothetical protein
MAFALTDEHAQLGKISNNLERHGKDEDAELITGFTLPLKLRVPRPQMIPLMGTDFDASVWKADNTPHDWTRRVTPIELTGEVYVEVNAEMILGDDHELTYEGCRVTHVIIEGFDPGGITRVNCHLYVRPGIGPENLLLQEFQEQEIAVQLSAGKLRVKADKAQQELALQPPKTERELAVERGEEVTVITTVVDQSVRHEHPSFDGGVITHTVGMACVVCEAPAAAIGTPEEERTKARTREQEIAQQLADAHANGNGPGDDDDDEDDEEMSGLGRQISAHAAKAT